MGSKYILKEIMLKVVEEFIEGENNKLNRLEKLFGNYPDFYFLKGITTEDISKYDYNLNRVVKIRPSIFTKLMALCFMLFGLYFCLMLLLMIIAGTLLPVTISFFLLMSVWTGAILWTYFLNPRSSFTIIISHSGIGISNLYITWTNLADVIVMQKGGGRHQRTTLVLFTTDSKIHKFSLNNLSISFKKLLAIIEYYQNRSRRNI